MNAFIETIDKATLEVDKLQKLLKKTSSKQIWSKDEKEVLKVVSLTWFYTHRPVVISFLNESLVEHIDKSYKELLSFAEKSPVRQNCISILKEIRLNQHNLRNENITSISKPVQKTADTIPSFSGFVSDPEMQKILSSRWDECIKCVEANAPLAAVVMMGGLLETLLLSKINKLPNQSSVYTARSSPKNHQGQTLPLKEWGLRNYIEVAHELNWITQTAKDLGAVLMDYRNYIHPFKQKAYGVFLEQSDARMLWELCKNISKQLI